MFQLLDEWSWYGPLNGYAVTVYDENGPIDRGEVDVGNITVYTHDVYDNQPYTVCVKAYNVFDEDTKLYSEPSCIDRPPARECECCFTVPSV